MALPLTLTVVKAQCRLPITEVAEEVLLQSYMMAAAAMFERLSKRSLTATDETALDANEQTLAELWMLLTVAHFYENRQPVITDLRAVVMEVPMTVGFLMDLIRVPTL